MPVKSVILGLYISSDVQNGGSTLWEIVLDKSFGEVIISSHACVFVVSEDIGFNVCKLFLFEEVYFGAETKYSIKWKKISGTR